ncbi:MAG: DUF4247 domain-containing protein [Corynebacterium sp.]|nr:DUF4247 domain-containing protein [Corynebacterium sp.]
MSRKGWGFLSIGSFILALLLFISSAAFLDSRPLIDDKAQRCEGGPAATIQRIIDRRTPEANAVDPATGVTYLKYRKEIITVTPKGDNNCVVQREDLTRYNSGFYVFLGNGFSPSSPSNSRNGNSGSTSGVK